jgi:hypothetical protein
MKRATYVLAVSTFLVLPILGYSAPFKVYPGAKLYDIEEPKQTEGVSNFSKVSKTPKVIIFTTNDFFENVVAFYRGIAREYRIPGREGRSVRLSTGQEIKEAYFILDNAADITSSNHWIKIQRPYLDKGRKGDLFYGKYEKIREITAIIEEDKRSYP